jgi:hypothetical protein
MLNLKRVALAIAGALIGGCVSPPMGPTVAVMPAPNKPLVVFQQDQSACREYAAQEISGGANQANTQQLGTAVLGTALGAGLGAAVGGGQGAAVGAGTGAIAGTAMGTAPAQRAQWSLPQLYDVAYEQWMYARGNQVPGFQATAPAPPPPPPPLVQ